MTAVSAGAQNPAQVKEEPLDADSWSQPGISCEHVDDPLVKVEVPALEECSASTSAYIKPDPDEPKFMDDPTKSEIELSRFDPDIRSAITVDPKREADDSYVTEFAQRADQPQQRITRSSERLQQQRDLADRRPLPQPKAQAIQQQQQEPHQQWLRNIMNRKQLQKSQQQRKTQQQPQKKKKFPEYLNRWRQQQLQQQQLRQQKMDQLKQERQQEKNLQQPSLSRRKLAQEIQQKQQNHHHQQHQQQLRQQSMDQLEHKRQREKDLQPPSLSRRKLAQEIQQLQQQNHHQQQQRQQQQLKQQQQQQSSKINGNEAVRCDDPLGQLRVIATDSSTHPRLKQVIESQQQQQQQQLLPIPQPQQLVSVKRPSHSRKLSASHHHHQYRQQKQQKLQEHLQQWQQQKQQQQQLILNTVPLPGQAVTVRVNRLRRKKNL